MRESCCTIPAARCNSPKATRSSCSSRITAARTSWPPCSDPPRTEHKSEVAGEQPDEDHDGDRNPEQHQQTRSHTPPVLDASRKTMGHPGRGSRKRAALTIG